MFRRIILPLALALSVLSPSLFALPTSAESEAFSSYSNNVALTEDHADVFRLYWAFFDRTPDVTGARYWVSQYDQCVTLLDITWSFGNSPEFVNRYGQLSNEQFVNLVYANVLDRSPDADGLAYWLDVLDSGQLIPAEVMLYFSLGSEFKNRRALPSDGRTYGGCTAPTPTTTSTTTSTTATPTTTATTTSTTTATSTTTLTVQYANCDAVRLAGANPIRSTDPGYRPGLDRDGDGIGCE